MADSVIKLRIDSQEYDANIKRAGQALNDYFNKVREGGGTLKNLDEDVLDAVKAMSSLGTKAGNVRGGLRELTQAVTDMTIQYRSLTDEERNSPLGAAMAQSLQEMTERAGNMRDAMADVSAAINNAASDTRFFDQAAGAVTVFTSTLQTAQGAAKLLGINLGDNVEVIAKLQAAMSVTAGLQQLQNMLQKQSALMQGINALQAEFNVLANMNPYALLATAIAAVAAGYMLWSSNADKAKRAQEALNAELDSTQRQLQQIDKDTDFSVGIAEAAGKSWKAIHDLRLEAVRTKLSLADLNFDKLFEAGASKEQLQRAMEMQQKAWDDVMKVLNEGTIHDIKSRYGGGGGRSGGHRGGGGGGSSVQKTEEQNINDEINKLTNEYITATDKRRQAIEAEIAVLQKRNDEIQRLKKMSRGEGFEAGELPEVTVTAELPPLMKMQERSKELNSQLGLAQSPLEYQNILSDIRAVEKEMADFKGENKKDSKAEDKKTVKLNESLSQMVGGINSMTSGLEQLGIDIPDGLKGMMSGISSLITIVSGISTILTAIEALSAADTILPLSRGGIVKAASGFAVSGRTYSGDFIPARLNAGEIVLNQAQAGVIANALQQDFDGGGNYSLPYVDGEHIFLGMNNTSKRMGRGEIVTTSMLRRYGLIK